MKTYAINTWGWRKIIGCGAFLVIVATADLAESQGTLISITGPPDTTHQWGGPLTATGYPEGVSWIATSAFSNVKISIPLDADAGATGMAYLTTKIGSGTTAANAIASSSFSFPSASSLTTVFSGLNLGDGTYYLVIQQTATGSTGNGMWDGTPTPSITSAASVTANGEYWDFNLTSGYPPASPFSEGSATHYEYNITSSPVPEPSAIWLNLLGGGAAVFVRECRRYPRKVCHF
jgi:hypothetical protein